MHIVGIDRVAVTSAASLAGIASSTISPALQRERILDQLLGRVRGLALHTETAELVHRLRREPEMAAHRDTALDQEFGGRRERRATLELDHVRAGRHQLRGAAKSLLGIFLIAAERQVTD